MKNILILTANPNGTGRLRLDEEVREISAALERSRHRDQFRIVSKWATRPDDLRRSLLDEDPYIIHFAGHGAGASGIVLENNAGGCQLVEGAALTSLFRAFRSKTRCVLLNACYSEMQAEAIYQQIDTVIGMKLAVGDRAALEFAVGFYDALFAGRSLSDAFDLGCTSIALEGIPEADTPVLKMRSLADQNLDQAPGQSLAKVFISYRSQSPDVELAQTLYQALKTAGHRPFMAGVNIRLSDRWSDRIEQELASCDYFLLLLSEQSVRSEMVTEEVRRAKELRDTRATGKPMILPVRVNFPLASPLNYDLRGYLAQIQQREWRTPTDTASLIREILLLLTPDPAPSSSSSPQFFSLKLPQAVPQPLYETLTTPPVPIAEPELPEGQVDLASAFYVERSPIDARCYEEIAKPGALIRIKAPRQMGKTSLMARILHSAGQQDCMTVSLSFQIADAAVFGDLDKFLRWFCASVGKRLGLPNRLSEQWDEIFGSKDNCTAYFEEYLLPKISQPLVLGLDEVDMVFNHPEIASDFFGLLRAWHEAAKNSALWKKLRLVVVHSTEVYIPMTIHQSPFNVGSAIELPEFDAAQVQDLAQRHGLSWSNSQIQSLMVMVGGHPYLVRVALYGVARGDIALTDLLQTAPTESGLYCDHLRRHLWNLEQNPDMVAAVRRMVASEQPVRLESVQAFQLNSMGLVHLQGNDVVFRCDLYRQYFNDRLRA